MVEANCMNKNTFCAAVVGCIMISQMRFYAGIPILWCKLDFNEEHLYIYEDYPKYSGVMLNAG